MIHDPIVVLLQLGVVMLIAVGAVVLVLRASSAPRAHPELLRGYPASHFPNQEVAHGQALIMLAATQARMLSMYERLPQRSPLTTWLRSFLFELRDVMDMVYQAALVTQAYGDLPQLEGIALHVQQIEAEVAGAVGRQLLSREASASSQLDPYLDALRYCTSALPYTASTVPLAGSPADSAAQTEAR